MENGEVGSDSLTGNEKEGKEYVLREGDPSSKSACRGHQIKKKACTLFAVPDTVRIIRGPNFDTVTPTSTPKRGAFHINPFKVFPTQALCCGSPTQLYQMYQERVMRSHGMVLHSVEVDVDTVMEIWAPKQMGIKATATLPLVMLHGFGAPAPTQWDGQVVELGKKIDLLMPNLLFHGNSFTRRSSDQSRSMDFQAECVLKVLDKLMVEKFDILGFSYGSAVSHRIAACRPERVRRVVLCDEGIMMTQQDMVVMQQELDIDDGRGYWNIPKTAREVKKLEHIAFRNPMWLPSFVYKDVLRTMFSANLKEWDELVKEYTEDRPADPNNNAVLSQDVLLIWGEDDPMAPLATGKMLQEHFGDSCRLVVLRGARHMAHAQYPKEFNHLVADFLLSTDGTVRSNRRTFVVEHRVYKERQERSRDGGEEQPCLEPVSRRDMEVVGEVEAHMKRGGAVGM